MKTRDIENVKQNGETLSPSLSRVCAVFLVPVGNYK
jgi:hypothetical protein